MEANRFDEHCSELFEEAFEDLFEGLEMELLELRKSGISPRLYKYFINDIMEDLKDVEKRFSTMRGQGYDIYDIREVLEGWSYQYRCKFYWDDEPLAESVPYIRPTAPHATYVF